MNDRFSDDAYWEAAQAQLDRQYQFERQREIRNRQMQIAADQQRAHARVAGLHGLLGAMAGAQDQSSAARGAAQAETFRPLYGSRPRKVHRPAPRTWLTEARVLFYMLLTKQSAFRVYRDMRRE